MALAGGQHNERVSLEHWSICQMCGDKAPRKGGQIVALVRKLAWVGFCRVSRHFSTASQVQLVGTCMILEQLTKFVNSTSLLLLGGILCAGLRPSYTSLT